MSPDFLEKIRNIIVILFVLFFSFLIMLITFCSLRVHAEEANSFVLKTFTGDYTYSYSNTNTSSNNYRECFTGYLHLTDKNFYAFVYDTETNPFGMFRLFYFDPGSGKVKVYASTKKSTYNFPTGFIGDSAYFDIHYVDTETNKGWSTNDICAFFVHPINTDPVFSSDLMIFNSESSMLSYCQSGDISGLINGGSIDNPDFEDTAYAFTGFTANNKMTATWTGTTERSYLKDQEVEEYVRVNYYFADKEAQDTIKQADAYPDEFATADKTLTIDVSGLKPDDENWFLRYIRITPCYRQAGLGVWGDFYHGSDVYVYFDVKGNIEKVIQKSKPTDLNKGNMVYDSSIGYLQNVIYTEQKAHDGSGRQATFKWSTLKSLPDDAQIEIVAQNFYIEWFNKKTEENFIYKEYGEDCFYSAGSYSFNANTPVWTWLKEKEIDPFSIKTQSYGSTEYYLRIVVYNDSDSLYHYGGWVKVDIKSKDTTIMPSTDVETGGFDDSSGLWNQDTASSDSYHYSTDDKGKLTGNIDVNSWEDLNMNSFTWMYRNMQSMVSSLGEFPAMVNAVFGYLPVQYITSIGVLLVAIVFLRFLGR